MPRDIRPATGAGGGGGPDDEEPGADQPGEEQRDDPAPSDETGGSDSTDTTGSDSTDTTGSDSTDTTGSDSTDTTGDQVAPRDLDSSDENVSRISNRFGGATFAGDYQGLTNTEYNRVGDVVDEFESRGVNTRGVTLREFGGTVVGVGPGGEVVRSGPQSGGGGVESGPSDPIREFRAEREQELEEQTGADLRSQDLTLEGQVSGSGQRRIAVAQFSERVGSDVGVGDVERTEGGFRLTEDAQRRFTARRASDETGVEIDPSEVTVEDGEATLTEAGQHRLAELQLEEEYGLDFDPSEVLVDDGNVSLTESAQRQVAAQQFSDSLPGVDVGADAVEAREVSIGPQGRDVQIRGPEGQTANVGTETVFSLSEEAEQEVLQQFETDGADVSVGDFGLRQPETGNVPTTRAGVSRESAAPSGDGRSSIEEQLEEQFGTEFVRGEDFEVQETDLSRGRRPSDRQVVLTDEGREAARKAQQEPATIDVPFVGEGGLDIPLFLPAGGGERTFTIPDEFELDPQADLGEKGEIQVGGGAVGDVLMEAAGPVEPALSAVGIGNEPITINRIPERIEAFGVSQDVLFDEFAGVPLAGAELEEFGSAAQRGTVETFEGLATSVEEETEGASESSGAPAGTVSANPFLYGGPQVEAARDITATALRGTGDILSQPFGAAAAAEEVTETGLGLAEGEVSPGEVAQQAGVLGVQTAEAAAQDPGRTVGALGASAVLFGGTAAVSPRLGSATRFAIQPGEEIASVGLTRAAPNVARRFPNERIDNEEILIQGAARGAGQAADVGRRGAGQVRSTTQSAVQGARQRSPVGVGFEFDPEASLLDVDPQLAAALSDVPGGVGTRIGTVGEGVRSSVRRGAEAPREGVAAARERAAAFDPGETMSEAAAATREAFPDAEFDFDPDVRGRLAQERAGLGFKAAELEDRAAVRAERALYGARQQADRLADPVRSLTDPEFDLAFDSDVQGRLTRERQAIGFKAAELEDRAAVRTERALYGARQQAGRPRDALESLADPEFELTLDPDVRGRLAGEREAFETRAAELEDWAVGEVDRTVAEARQRARQQASRARGAAETVRESPEAVAENLQGLADGNPFAEARTAARRAAAAPTVRFTFEGDRAGETGGASVPDEFAPDRLEGLGLETESETTVESETDIDPFDLEGESEGVAAGSVDVESSGGQLLQGRTGTGREFDLEQRGGFELDTEAADTRSAFGRFEAGDDIDDATEPFFTPDREQFDTSQAETPAVNQGPRQSSTEFGESEIPSGFESEFEREFEPAIESEFERELGREREQQQELGLAVDLEQEGEWELEFEFESELESEFEPWGATDRMDRSDRIQFGSATDEVFASGIQGVSEEEFEQAFGSGEEGNPFDGFAPERVDERDRGRDRGRRDDREGGLFGATTDEANPFDGFGADGEDEFDDFL